MVMPPLGGAVRTPIIIPDAPKLPGKPVAFVPTNWVHLIILDSMQVLLLVGIVGERIEKMRLGAKR